LISVVVFAHINEGLRRSGNMTFEIRRSSSISSEDDEWLSCDDSSTSSHQNRMEDRMEDTQKKKPPGLLSSLKKSRFTSSSIFRRRQKVKAPAAPEAGAEARNPSPCLAGSGPSAATSDKPVPNESLESPPGASLQGLQVTLDSGSSSQLSTEVHVDETRLAAPASHQHASKPENTTSWTHNPLTSKHNTATNHGNDVHNNITLLPPALPVTSSPRPHLNAHVWSDILRMDPNNPSNTPNLSDLLTSLSSQEDASRKMAAFKLQTLINDPSFAEHFVHAGGLPLLRTLVLETSGNTLAYSLSSFARLLEVDQGWEAVDNQVVEKVSRHVHIVTIEANN
jgi:hypothetical protein